LLTTLRVVGAIGLCSGVFAVILAAYAPAYRVRLEEVGGGLLVGGLALIGVTFAMV
jgi:hypothetical protein